MTYYEDEIVYK